MIRFSGVNFKEKRLMKAVEKAVFGELKQENFFVTDIAVVDEETIRSYNREQRNVDAVTDVLSFPYFEKMTLPKGIDEFQDDDFDGKRVLLGSIMICRKRAEDQAKEYGHSYDREIGFLTCHGLLHILGFDHVEKSDEEVMMPLQEKIMNGVHLYR